MLQHRIAKYITIILYSHVAAYSLRLSDIRYNLVEELKQLLKDAILKEQLKKREVHHLNDNLHPNLENELHEFIHANSGKSYLVSRIVPHGYPSVPYEYDSKLKALYKPLVRFHVKKPLVKRHKDSLANLLNKAQVLAVIVQRNSKKNKNKVDKNVANVDKTVVNEDKKDANVDKKALRTYNELLERDVEQKLEKDDDVKLTEAAVEEMLDKSKETPDPFDHRHEEHHESDMDVHNTVLPEYPFWNYWTYTKTIYQDNCPKGLVKLGGTCVTATGFRRLAEYLSRRS